MTETKKPICRTLKSQKVWVPGTLEGAPFPRNIPAALGSEQALSSSQPVIASRTKQSLAPVRISHVRQLRMRRSIRPISALTMTPSSDKITTPANSRSRS